MGQIAYALLTRSPLGSIASYCPRSTCMYKTRHQRSFWARIKLFIIFYSLTLITLFNWLEPLLKHISKYFNQRTKVCNFRNSSSTAGVKPIIEFLKLFARLFFIFFIFFQKPQIISLFLDFSTLTTILHTLYSQFWLFFPFFERKMLYLFWKSFFEKSFFWWSFRIAWLFHSFFDFQCNLSLICVYLVA